MFAKAFIVCALVILGVLLISVAVGLDLLAGLSCGLLIGMILLLVFYRAEQRQRDRA